MAPIGLACPNGEEEGSALVLGIGLRLWQSALSFPSLSFVYKSIVFLLFGLTDNSLSSLLLHHLLVSTPIHKEMLAWILIPHLRRILPMRAMICQTWILKMRSFSRRKGSLGRKRKMKRRREMRRRAMRRAMRKMSRFQTMTWSTV
jgi:hypothetical protein